MVAFTLFDYIALIWFFFCWVVYVQLADNTRWQRQSVSARMNEYRKQWMLNMVRRELRMIDTMIHGNLLHGTAFFASTSILLVGGLLAVLGATDKAIAVLAELPFVSSQSRTEWEMKVLLLVVIFVYAFFKFAWCFRLFNYCSILIGAAPLETTSNAKSDAFANRIGRLYSLASKHFNSGLRAYFFALAALGWFLHPLLLIACTTWVTYVLYRREFRSRSFAILSEAD